MCLSSLQLLFLFACAVAAQSYTACASGDAACAGGSPFTSGSVAYCCPNGAFPDPVAITCDGGSPAGCASTGHGQPVFETCTATMPSCGSGSQGCVSGTTQTSFLGISAIGQSACPSGMTPRVDSMQVTTTGTLEYGGGIDYYGSGASSSLRVLISKTPSKCYQLILPYTVVGQPNWAIRCANLRRVPTPSPPLSHASLRLMLPRHA